MYFSTASRFLNSQFTLCTPSSKCFGPRAVGWRKSLKTAIRPLTRSGSVIAKYRAYEKNDKPKRRIYVKSENDQALGWFHRRAGRGCRLTRHRPSHRDDRHFEFSQSAGRPDGLQNGHRQLL